MKATDKRVVDLRNGDIAKVGSTGGTTLSPFPYEMNFRKWKSSGHVVQGTSLYLFKVQL